MQNRTSQVMHMGSANTTNSENVEFRTGNEPVKTTQRIKPAAGRGPESLDAAASNIRLGLLKKTESR